MIDLVEHSRPITVRAFSNELAKRHARIVLTFTNVVEMLPRLPSGLVDVSRAVNQVERLQQLPIAYIRQPDLTRRELRGALLAYEDGRAVPKLDPYFEQWWETFSKRPPEVVKYIEPQMYELYRELTLSQQVQQLLASGADLRARAKNFAPVVEGMAEDREQFGSRRDVPETWLAAVSKPFSEFGWQPPRNGVPAFAQFLRDNPETCPSFQLGVALYEESRANITAPLKPSDIADYSHVRLLPYVSFATLDRSWRTRCAQAATRLERAGRTQLALTRVVPDLRAILDMW